MLVEVTMPDEFKEAVMVQLTRRHGLLVGNDGTDGWTTLTAEVSIGHCCQCRKESRYL